MNKKNEQLDEMQRHRKNDIGNQSFQLLFYLIMIDAGLYGFGIKWVAYPANVVIIATVTCGIYLVRLIRAQSLIGPTKNHRRPLTKISITVLLATLCAFVFTMLASRFDLIHAEEAADSSAIIMFITSIVALVIVSGWLMISRLSQKE